MNTKIINLIFTLILAFPILRLFGFYFSLYTNYMLDNAFKRNVSLEKKRLFIYSLAIPILFICYYDLLDSLEHNSKVWTISAIVTIASTFVVTIGLYLIWTPAFRKVELKLIKKAAAAMSNISDYTILDNDLKIKKIYKNLQHEYLNCSIDSFLCLLLQTPLNELPKIQWINGSTKKNTKANQRTLVVFLCKLFPNRMSDDKFIEEIISKYFCDKENNEIKISQPAIYQSRPFIKDSESASPNVKNLLDTIDNSLNF